MGENKATGTAQTQDGISVMSQSSGETYTVQATEDYTAKYGEAVGAYVEYVKGAAILVKSTSAEISLTEGSVWEVKEASELTSLTVSADSKVIGTIEAEKTETQADGSTVYTNVTVRAE